MDSRCQTRKAGRGPPRRLGTMPEPGPRAARASWTFETNTIVNFCDYFIFQSLKYVLVLSIVAFKYNS